MEITEIETVPFGIPAGGFADSYTTFDRAKAVLVKVHCDSGHVGIGEACALEPEFYGETLESIEATIHGHVAPAITGMDPRNVNRVLAQVDRALARVTCVKEGIDLALHDLLGKVREVPVWELLGGKFRDRVRIASEIGSDEPEAMAERAREIVDEGITVIKLKGSADTALDIERVRAVHDAVGAEAALRIDPNTAWSTTGTIQVMTAVADCGLEVLEQPIPTGDLKGLAHIRRNTDVPVMADESVFTTKEAVKLHDYDAADLLNLKIAKTGGLSNGKRFEAVADALGLGAIAGTELEPGIASVAKIHFAASLRNHPLASEFTEVVQLDGSILVDPPELVSGALVVPDGPGFGVEIDEDRLAEYEIDTGQ